MRTLFTITLITGFFSLSPVQAQTNTHGNPFLSATDSKADITNYKLTSQSETVMIEWTTTAELRNKYFTVEKSINGFVYRQVGAQDAAGTSENTNYYRMVDMDPHYGDSYYRLIYTDKFGVSEVLETATVFHDGEEHLNDNGLPNAVKKGSVIIMQNFNVLSGINQVNIIDVNGVVVHTQYLNEEQLRNDVDLKIPANLPTGIYELRVIGIDNLISYTDNISVY